MTTPQHPDSPASDGPEPEYDLAPEHVHAHGHEHSEDAHEEGDHAQSKPRARYRLPFAHLSPAAMAKWKRETRFGIAALLSFVIFVTAMIMNRGQKLVPMQVPNKNEPTASSQASAEKPREPKSPKGDEGASNPKASEAEKGEPPNKPATAPEPKAETPKGKPEEHKTGDPAPTDLPSATSGPSTPDQTSLPDLPPGPATDVDPPIAQAKSDTAGDTQLPMGGPMPPTDTNPPLPAPGADSNPLGEKTQTTDLTSAASANNVPPVPVTGETGAPSAVTPPADPMPLAPATNETATPANLSPTADLPIGGAPPPGTPATGTTGATSPTPTTPEASQTTPQPATAAPPATPGGTSELPMPMPPEPAPGGSAPSPTPGAGATSSDLPLPKETAPAVAAVAAPAAAAAAGALAAGASTPPGGSSTELPPGSSPTGATGSPPAEPAPMPTAPNTPTEPPKTEPPKAETLENLPNASAPVEPPSAKPLQELRLTPTPSSVEAPVASAAEVTPASTATAAAMGLVALPNLGRGKFPEDDPIVSDSSASDITDIAPPGQKVSEPEVESEPHVVVSGENFWTISKDYYGSGRYYIALWKANHQLVSAPDKLAVGMTVRIPPPESLDRSLIEPARTPRATASTSPSSVHRTARPVSKNGRTQASVRNVELTLPVADTLEESSPRSSQRDEDAADDSVDRPRRKPYKVRRNETARSIARDLLGSPGRYKEILELNSNVLDEHDVIAAGQIIELPEDAQIGRRRR